VAPVPHRHLRPLVGGAHRALGDAAHTAHFSIGSGTKLAMEDAIGLVEALRDAPDRASAFAAYERRRRPAVERLQELARRSRLWWESFPARLSLPAARLMVAYMSRAGTCRSTVRRDQPGRRGRGAAPVRRSCAADRPGRRHQVGAGAAGGGACRPVDRRRAARRPVGPGGDAVVARAGRVGLRLVGPPDRDAVLDRLDLAERVRIETGTFVEVDAPPRCATTSPPGWSAAAWTA
jgi:hypothetical protein